jgi:Domain of unknown function (DUF1995)
VLGKIHRCVQGCHREVEWGRRGPGGLQTQQNFPCSRINMAAPLGAMLSPAFLTPGAAPRLAIPAHRCRSRRPRRGSTVCSPRKRHRARPRVCCRAAGEPPPCEVPRTEEEIVDAICAGLAACGSAPRTKVHALVPGLIPGVEDAYPYNETLLYDLVLAVALRRAEAGITVCLLFKSAGTTAAAANYYAKSGKFATIPPSISYTSYFPRDAPKGGGPLLPAGALGIFVNPVNSRGDPVILDLAKIVESCAPSCRWIMFNPDFTADRSALGVAEVARRDEFLSSFVDAFYIRYLFTVSRPALEAVERGVVLRKFPGLWQVQRLDKPNQTYLLVAAHEDLPPRHRITDAFDTPPTRVLTVQDKLGQFSVDDRSYLTTLLSLAVFASAMFYYIRAVHP